MNFCVVVESLIVWRSEVEIGMIRRGYKNIIELLVFVRSRDEELLCRALKLSELVVITAQCLSIMGASWFSREATGHLEESLQSNLLGPIILRFRVLQCL